MIDVRVTAATIAALLVAGCVGGTVGEGSVQTEPRQIAVFTRIEATAGTRVTVTVGAEPAVEVSAQANILPLIATEVESGTLRIRSTAGYTSIEPVTVRVVVPSLEAITLSGGSNAEVNALAAEAFEASVSGGSVLVARGSARTVNLTASGGSRVELGELAASNAVVDASGGSTATLQASSTVTGSSTGGSSVTVAGDASVDVETSAGGTVNRR